DDAEFGAALVRVRHHPVRLNPSIHDMSYNRPATRLRGPGCNPRVIWGHPVERLPAAGEENQATVAKTGGLARAVSGRGTLGIGRRLLVFLGIPRASWPRSTG